MEYPIKISKNKHHKAALKIINCFLNLTEFELDIISGMLDNNMQFLNTRNRKILRNQLDDISVYSFNNYIKRLRDKKYLIPSKLGLELHPTLISAANDTEIKITIDVT